MRQQEHQRRLQSPLRARRRHELIEDDLRAVDEVAVLRFPEHEMRGLLDVVAELEADGAVLAERAVVNLERRARLLERLQRDEAAAVRGVVEDRVATAEGAAPTSSPVSLIGCRRQGSSRTPVPRRGPIDRSPVGLSNIAFRRSRPRSSFLWNVKPAGAACSRVDLAKAFDRDTRDRSGGRAGWRQLRHRRDVILLGLERRERLLEIEVFLHQPVGNLARHRSLRGELLGKQLAHGLVRGDGFT